MKYVEFYWIAPRQNQFNFTEISQEKPGTDKLKQYSKSVEYIENLFTTWGCYGTMVGNTGLQSNDSYEMVQAIMLESIMPLLLKSNNNTSYV